MRIKIFKLSINLGVIKKQSYLEYVQKRISIYEDNMVSDN